MLSSKESSRQQFYYGEMWRWTWWKSPQSVDRRKGWQDRRKSPDQVLPSKEDIFGLDDEDIFGLDDNHDDTSTKGTRRSIDCDIRVESQINPKLYTRSGWLKWYTTITTLLRILLEYNFQCVFSWTKAPDVCQKRHS
jgi:hypothetical protein